MNQQSRYVSLITQGQELADRLNAGMSAIGIHLAAMGDVPSGRTVRVRLGSLDEATVKRLLRVVEAALPEGSEEER